MTQRKYGVPATLYDPGGVLGNPPEEFEHQVRDRLRRFLRRLRWYVLAEGLAWTSLTLFACFLFQISVDYIFRLPLDMRGALLGAILLLTAVTAWRTTVAPLRRRLELQDAAQVLERRFPDLQSRLISAVQFAAGPGRPPSSNSPVLIRRVVEEAAEIVRPLPVEQVLNHRRARLQSLTICAVLAVAVGLTLFAQEAMGTWFERNVLLSDANWKQETYLVLLNDEDGDGTVYAPRGDDLVIRVHAEGRRPRQVELGMRFETGQQETQPMTAVGQREFRFTIPRLNHGLSLWLRGGDARSPEIRIEVVDRPRITDATIRIYPPPYTGEPPYQLRSGKGLIEVLHGSEVELSCTVNKNLSTATLTRDGEPAADAEVSGPSCLARFKPDHDAVYAFELTDLTGLSNPRPRRFIIRMVRDDAPSVSLQATGVGELVTAQAVLPLTVTLKDRYGLARAGVIYQVQTPPAPARRLDIENLVPGNKQLQTALTLSVADTGVQPGGQLSLHAEAEDHNDVGGPGVGISSKYTFRVGTAEELLAELSRREQEFRQEYERLIKLQESVRSDLLSAATVFERRPAAGATLNLQPLVRRQRQIARQVGHVSEQFQSIYDELVINRLETAQIRVRLVQGVVEPLQGLAGRSLTQAADRLDELHEQPSAGRFAEADRQFQELLSDMRRILGNMSTWEGYHETVSLLQSIIRLQEDLQSETDRTLNMQLDEIFKNDAED